MGNTDFTGINLSFADSGKWCRGMICAYSNKLNISPPSIINFSTNSNFEIRGISFQFVAFKLNIIMAYRSPSMSLLEASDFFNQL